MGKNSLSQLISKRLLSAETKKFPLFIVSHNLPLSFDREHFTAAYSFPLRLFHTLQSFLNMKYDRCKTPVRVLASAFDRLLKKVAGEDDRSLLTKHYRLDSNAVPPVYLFQGCATEEEAEMICEILRSSWGKEEKERYMASGE